MVPGLQIAGLFLAITAVLAFTAWAETWLTAAASVGRRLPSAKPSAAGELSGADSQGDIPQAA